MRYLLEIEYDGSSYLGWQFQENLKTIQGTIEEKLNILLRKKVKIFSAGRTDKGVHALQQFAHFESEITIDKKKFIYSINSLLKNENIIIKNIKKVSNQFHARFSCKLKEYQYHLLIDNKHNIFLNKRYFLIPKFNIEKANKCLEYIIGTHDFSSFRDSHCQAKSPIKTIEFAKFIKRRQLAILKIKAKSFLHHQIRIIVGTIVEIILKNKPAETMKIILDKKNRIYAGPSAKAQGLYMKKIIY